jgi:osmotically-inducible protein OsmY
MENNSALQKDVQNAIKWESTIQAAEICVTAKDGIVTLPGTVDKYSKKLNAERAAKKVVGVKSIIEEVLVDAGYAFIHTDREIEDNILEA